MTRADQQRLDTALEMVARRATDSEQLLLGTRHFGGTQIFGTRLVYSLRTTPTRTNSGARRLLRVDFSWSDPNDSWRC
jgi:hypothetical protein